MLSNLFKARPLLDANTSDWIIDTFSWALENFELTVFKDQSQLILPTNEFYPGSVNSVHQMAQSVFEHTLKYAGMELWPIELVEPQAFEQQAMPKLAFDEVMRGSLVKINQPAGQNQSIKVSYNPQQINQPQDLVASFAQAFATILIVQSDLNPPGGKEYLPQTVDLVACFMGFGVMFANTAYQFKGGCGSCNNPYANRNAALAEQEMLYCLALFSVLKSIKVKTVCLHLKSHLRADFKKAYKEHVQLLQQSAQPALLAANQSFLK